MNKETSVILCALRREATNQGAAGNELSSFISDMLYRIAKMIEDELAGYEELEKKVSAFSDVSRNVYSELLLMANHYPPTDKKQLIDVALKLRQFW